MTAPPFDLAKANRWFAIELNNRAWDLIEKKDRTADETAEMLHAAHASTYHWSQAGTAINAVRALNLLSTAYAAAGRAEWAWEYATAGRTALEKLTEGVTPFDRGATAGALAHAAALARRSDAPDLRRAALDAWSPLEPDDRAVLERLYPE